PTATHPRCSRSARRPAWCSARPRATSTATGWRPRGWPAPSPRAWPASPTRSTTSPWRLPLSDGVFSFPAVDDAPTTEVGVILMGLDAERLLAGLGTAALGDDPAL